MDERTTTKAFGTRQAASGTEHRVDPATARRRRDRTVPSGRTTPASDERRHPATPLRGVLNRVFPEHWSFLLGEIALYSLVMLVVTGVFLAAFFEPSMDEVVYDGSYTPLRGTPMSSAYASTLDISFDVRGGLLLRQMHHWASMLFMASIVMYLLRVFFTGAFRTPRKPKWIVGLLVFWVGLFTSYTGYMMLDDGLSASGLRVLWSITLSVPVVGTWLTSTLFGGEFPGEVIVGRFYILHVLLLPALLLALFAVLIGLRLRHKPAQWPGAGRTNANVVGARLFPRYAVKQVGLFLLVFGVIALLGGLVQVNPVWLFGPSHAAVAAAASQPAWYVMFLDGAVRLMPPWEITVPIGDGYAIPPTFWPAVVLPTILVVLPMAYPLLEERMRRDNREHHLLDRPRDVPTRTALGAMAITFYLVLTVFGASDVIAFTFDVSTNAMTWAGRVALLLLPPAAYWITYRVCLGLQQHDREVLAHGVETGIIRRLPHGGYMEILQPLAAPGPDGRTKLPYTGQPVPKKVNHLVTLATRDQGFRTPVDPPARVPASVGKESDPADAPAPRRRERAHP